jgi:ABC-type bacteriocin/lantibiotic exporter with double-glycine peptidase domain
VTTYAQTRFAEMSNYNISKRLVEGYLHQPYNWFLNHHSALLGERILSEVSHVVANGICAMMELLTKSFVAIALITLIMIIDLKLALMIGFSLGIAYGLIFKIVSNYLSGIGNELVKNNQKRFLSINEAFSAVKEIKVGPNTSENDLSYRIKHMIEFLQKGHRIKISMQFKGREMSFVSKGVLVMLNMVKAVEEYVLQKHCLN